MRDKLPTPVSAVNSFAAFGYFIFRIASEYGRLADEEKLKEEQEANIARTASAETKEK